MILECDSFSSITTNKGKFIQNSSHKLKESKETILAFGNYTDELEYSLK